MGLFDNFPPRKPRIICEAIGTGRWHGDNGPKWTEGRQRRRSPSAADAEVARQKVVKQLKRSGRYRPVATDLRRRIMSCKRKSPCVSPACPACMRAAQCFAVKQGSRFFRAQGRELLCASAIPLEGFDEGSLPADPFQVLGDRIRKVLTAAGVPWAFVGFDLSLNECPGAPTQYRPHAWIIAEKEGMKPAIKLLRRAFPSDSTTTPRPLVAMDFDGALPGIAYAFKREFYRRVTIPAEVSNDGTHRRRNTRPRPLKVLQEVEAMLAMDGLGFEGRILLHGLEFQRTEKGWRLVMLGEKPT